MRRISRFQDQAGIAMVTVLLVGTALTVLASTAAFVTVRELRAGNDDRKGAISLAYAEAGVDRLFNYLRSGRVTWGQIRNAGCTDSGRYYPPLTFPGGVAASPSPANGGQGQLSTDGSFQVQLTVYDPSATGDARFPPAACISSAANPRATSARTKQYFAITSTGRSPAATRVVREVLRIGTFGLPVGLYADNSSASGNPDYENISMITRVDVTGRKFMQFSGTDPYYTLQDFWPQLSANTFAPAAIHSLGTIFTTQNLLRGQEHPSSEALNSDPMLSCQAQRTGTQSKWDQSSKGGQINGNCAGYGDVVAPPPSSLMTQDIFQTVAPRPELTQEDYQALRVSARERGLYCTLTECKANGTTWSGFTALSLFGTNDITGRGFEDNFVAFFDFASLAATNEVKWQASYGRCADPEPATTPNQSVTIVVRNGHLTMATGGEVRGAALLPEGIFSKSGTTRFVGTVIAKEIRAVGGTKFALDSCWVKNMPGPFLDYEPYHFSEIDR